MRPLRHLARYLAPSLCAFLTLPLLAASHMVTGNGFGFAVVSPETASVTRFYAHPYSFVRPDPKNPYAEGEETTNFIKCLQWADSDNSTKAASTDYDHDSHVIHARSANGEGFFFMPFGLNRDAFIVNWQPSQPGAWRVEWSHPVSSQKMIHVDGLTTHLLRFDGILESLLLIPLGASHHNSTQPEQLLASHQSWAFISIENARDAEQAARDFTHWQAGLPTRALAQREIAQLDLWRVKPTVHFTSDSERHLWRQSEVMLRMAQSREPNRPGRNGHGLIVACLPDGVYFTPWVRDMAYALVALTRMGHQAEARAGLLAYFNAQPTGKMRALTSNADYQVSVVRYFGNGEEEPFFTMESAPNIEFDDWGLALWVLGQYLDRFHDPAVLTTPTFRGPLYQSARDFIAKPLLANLEPNGLGLIVGPDTSIWEEHQPDKKHFAFSTAMAIVGLRNFADVARRAGDPSTQAKILRKVALLQAGFNAAFIRDGHLHGTLEQGVKNDIDGALLAIINFGVVTDPAIVRDTVERMNLLKVASGGYRRVRGTYIDPAIFEYWYEQEEFLFVDFSLAEVDHRLGETSDAAAILQRIVRKSSADNNLIPEMYVAVPCRLFPGNLGDPTGALPMVGYGAGEFILYLLERERITHTQ
jgi:hypothetical protein